MEQLQDSVIPTTEVPEAQAELRVDEEGSKPLETPAHEPVVENKRARTDEDDDGGHVAKAAEADDHDVRTELDEDAHENGTPKTNADVNGHDAFMCFFGRRVREPDENEQQPFVFVEVEV